MSNKEQVFKLIADSTKTDIATITESTSFIDDLNLDSLDMVEMMMKMEDEFDIEIPESDTDTLKTVGDVVTYLSSKKD